MELFIIRHADPDYEQDTITAYGELEAAELAGRMADTGIDEVYSSPMGRAQKTARITCERLQKTYAVEPWAHEVSLQINHPDGRRVWISEMPATILRSQSNIDRGADWHQSEDFSGFSGGEIARYVARESDAFLERLGYRREAYYYRVTRENKKRIAVFCHGGLSATWLAHLIGIPYLVAWSSFGMHTTGVSKISISGVEGEAAAPQCHYWNDTSHLYAANIKTSGENDKPVFRL